MDDTVATLCRRIASGDTEAFSRFYRRYFDQMAAHASAIARRDESFCLDCVHDAMLKVIRAIKVFESESQLDAWLRAVVRSCAIDRLRAEARRVRRERAAVRRAEAHAADRAAELDDRLRWLDARLAELDPDARSMISLRHRFGLTLASVGRVFALSPGAVDGRINRSIKTMQVQAKEDFDE